MPGSNTVLTRDDRHDASAGGPVVTVFRSRLRAQAAAPYADLAPRLEARARSMPGLLEFKTFTADDGERLSIVVFDTWENHCAWRDDPEHRRAQARGRREFYEEYSIQVCQQLDHRGSADPSTSGLGTRASKEGDE